MQLSLAKLPWYAQVGAFVALGVGGCGLFFYYYEMPVRADMAIRQDTGVIVLAIRKATGEMAFNPPAEAKISAGDHLIAMGQPQGLQKLEQLLTGTA